MKHTTSGTSAADAMQDLVRPEVVQDIREAPRAVLAGSVLPLPWFTQSGEPVMANPCVIAFRRVSARFTHRANCVTLTLVTAS